MSDGTFRVMRYTNYTTECTEDAYVEPEEEYDMAVAAMRIGIQPLS